jgi:hypothetical protein
MAGQGPPYDARAKYQKLLLLFFQKEALILGRLETDPSNARKHFFLKKEAKTFAYLAYALGQRERLINKSFLVLFLKKELLPFLVQPHLWSRSGMSQT